MQIMKKKNIGFILLAAMALFVAACDKGDDFLYKEKMLSFALSGYNGSGQDLEVQIDTLQKKFYLSNGKFNANAAYTFPEGKSTVHMTVREKSGKVVLEKDVKKEEGTFKLNFFYLNGQVGDMPAPPPFEEGKIKLKYMWMPTQTKYTGPVDIAVGKLYFLPKVFEELARVKNVKPGEFCETISIDPFPTAGQTYNGQPTPVLFVIYIYKAGTNEFYTNGTGYDWSITTTAPKPSANVASTRMYIFSENPAGSLMAFVKNLEI